MSIIASVKNRLDGVIATARVNHCVGAMSLTKKISKNVMCVNYIVAFYTKSLAGKQMALRNSAVLSLLVASMGELVANKGMLSPVCNSSNAAFIQLARSLAMKLDRPDAEIRDSILFVIWPYSYT